MRVSGEWLVCDDGVTRPTVRAYVRGQGDRLHSDDFLIDSGADRTALGAQLWRRLQLTAEQPGGGSALLGVGGGAAFVVARTVVELVRDDGRSVAVQGEFAAFTDPQATDLSILGRDVLDHFDIILSRRRNEVLLLATVHRYQVLTG